MHTPTIILRVDDLIEYLNSQDGPMTSRKHELHAAIILARFISWHQGEEHWIALPAKEKMRREFYRAESIDDFDALMKEFGEHDVPQDIFLVPNSEIEKRQEKRPRGQAYQFKHVFPKPTGISMEDQLIKYLNEDIPKKIWKSRQHHPRVVHEYGGSTARDNKSQASS